MRKLWEDFGDDLLDCSLGKRQVVVTWSTLLILGLVGDAMIVVLEGGADVLPNSLSDMLEASS